MASDINNLPLFVSVVSKFFNSSVQIMLSFIKDVSDMKFKDVVFISYAVEHNAANFNLNVSSLKLSTIKQNGLFTLFPLIFSPYSSSNLLKSKMTTSLPTLPSLSSPFSSSLPLLPSYMFRKRRTFFSMPEAKLILSFCILTPNGSRYPLAII